MWRRFWSSLPLSYKNALGGLLAVMMATMVVMAGTYVSAGESLKLQLERQVSRDLNVFEKWYRTRLEEMQLTAVGLVRHGEIARAISGGEAAPASALLEAEVQRLRVHMAVLVDRQGRLVGSGGVFDPHGSVSAAMIRGEQVVSTERWEADAVAALPAPLRHTGLVRQVVTPVGPPGRPIGALVLADRVDASSPVPGQVAAMIGGGIGLLDHERIVAASGFQADAAITLSPEVWRDLRAGRYFFIEQDLEGDRYLYMFRSLLDYQGQPVGAFMRGFPESHIGETLARYAGGIAMLTAAAVVFSLLAFLWLTRRLLFPLRRLARISLSLAEGQAVEVPAPRPGNDEFKRLEAGVALLADRLMQSREELAETAVKLEVEARQLAALNQEKAGLLEVLREHDRLRGQLLEKIITAQEDERKRIARELHDETGQSLTSLLVGLKYVEGAKSLEEARERTAHLKQLTVLTLEEVHKLSVALRPAMLDDLGLVVTLRSLIKDFGAQHGIAAHFDVDAFEGRLPPLWEVTLYRVVQEALTNVAKYAQAQRVDVRMRVEDGKLSLVVEDDGVGFDPQAVAEDRREHLGLAGMQERMEIIGGTFTLKTRPGHGTRIEADASLPLDPLLPMKGHPSHA
ncbi:MAG: ATP-binding protein [Candidatus Sericytochromatia bacterium]